MIVSQHVQLENLSIFQQIIVIPVIPTVQHVLVPTLINAQFVMMVTFLQVQVPVLLFAILAISVIK